MAVPLLDLAAQNQGIEEAIESAALEVLRAQSFILGPRVERFERAMAELVRVPHAVGMSSGSDALIASLMAEDIGVGDEVVTTPFSFFATVGAILRIGATPVFADIEPGSCNIDPLAVERAVGSRTRAILPVHLYGRMADVLPLCELARGCGAVLIEDAAQAIGASSDAGRAGAVGDYGCFSFFPSKNLGGAGDGGLVTCRDAASAERLKRLRAHGASRPHDHEELGGNFRLDALQAAILEVKLSRLAAWTEARRSNAARYRRLFDGADIRLSSDAAVSAECPLMLPEDVPGHVFNQYVVRAHRRDELAAHLGRHGIGHAVYYPRPIHEQPALSRAGITPEHFPEAERAAREVLALPIFPGLTDAQAEEVVGRIAEFYAS